MQIEFTSMAPGRDGVLTIGVFDGIHLGHRHLARQVMRHAQEVGCLSGIIALTHKLVWRGQVEAAARLLGRRYHVSGTVVACGPMCA